MRLQFGAVTQFRRISTGELLDEPKGFRLTMDDAAAALVRGGDWVKNIHYWPTAKEGITAELEVGMRRRLVDPPTTAQLGGRVRFRRDSDGQLVGEDITYIEFVTLDDLTTEDRIVYTTSWQAAADIEGVLKLGARQVE